MKKFFTLAAICVLGVALSISCSRMSSNEKQPAGIEKSDVDSLSYMLGYSFGMNLSQSDFGAVNLDKLCDGIKDAIDQVEVTEQDFYRVVNGFMEKRRNAIATVNLEKSKKFLEANAKEEGVITTESGLQYRIDTVGNGVFPTDVRDTVEVNYEGSNLDGEVFDSSFQRGSTVEFPLDGVIKGWGEGLMKADEGSTITLWIPSELGYGDSGAGKLIQPNATLKFKVQLVKVKPFVEKIIKDE